MPFCPALERVATLKIEAQTEADAARAERACRDEKRVEKGLPLFCGGCRAECVKVDELGTEGEDGFVKQVINLDDGAEAHSFFEAKLTRQAEVEQKEAGA